MLSTLRKRPNANVALVPVKPKLTFEERQCASRKAALAVLGGRFTGGVKEALAHEEFQGVATRHYTDQFLDEYRGNAEFVAAAKAAEEQRLAAEDARVAAERAGALDLQRSNDPEYVAHCFSQTLLIAAEGGVQLSQPEVQHWKALFEQSDPETLRDMSYRFQLAAWSGVVERADSSKQPRGNDQIRQRAMEIFGEKAAWSARSIADAVAGRRSGERKGRPCSYPKEIEEVLVRFIAKLRQCKAAVYKWTVMDYAMRLISKHEAALNFARVDADGNFVRNEELGGFEWDMCKLDHWYYRRFLGDHPELSTGDTTPQGLEAQAKCTSQRWKVSPVCPPKPKFLLKTTTFSLSALKICIFSGNQRLLDSSRAKWGTAANMRPHYDNIIRELIGNGIARRNPLHDPNDKDADGMPKEPEAVYVPGEEYRVISFDEMKADDTTHGSGGDRKAKTERSVRCGPDDDGECVGSKHASHVASVVGGTIGTFEALPCFACTASETLDLAWFENGPTTIINGKLLMMDGDCNTKGSINNKTAIEYMKRSVLRAFEARALPTAEKKGIVICDGVGSHLSEELLDFMIEHHLILILRTPNCSQKQQPEDLVSFQRVKSKKDGFYVKKQQLLMQLLAETGSGIPYDRLFGECLKGPWERGFSAASNREAWEKAGLNERGAITCRPYWVQLRAEQPVRKQKSQDARKRAIEEFALGKEGAYEELHAPWLRQRAGSSTALITCNAGADGDDDGGGTARLTSGELSQLGCAATDPAARKYERFRKDMNEVKKMNAGELKEELGRLGVPYTNATSAKVTLLRSLEATYASTDTVTTDGRELSLPWKVLPSWLPKDLCAVMFPQLEQQEQQQQTQAAPAKKRRLGEGAYLCCAQTPATLLVLPSPTVPALPPPAQAVASQQQQPTTPVVHVVPGREDLALAQHPTA